MDIDGAVVMGAESNALMCGLFSYAGENRVTEGDLLRVSLILSRLFLVSRPLLLVYLYFVWCCFLV